MMQRYKLIYTIARFSRKDLEITASDGKHYQTQSYSLDAIISVG
jgi:hypothetical protein